MEDAIELDFFLDPSCRWAWWASVWLRRVMRERPAQVNWKLFSLAVQDSPEDYRNPVRPDHAHHIRDFDLLRALALARRSGGNDGLDRLFVAFGNAIHGAKEDVWDAAVRGRCLEAAGLPRGFFDDALNDPSTEEEVIRETREALDRGAPGTPSLALKGSDTCLLGPIIGQVPAGEDALRLWDQVLYALRTPYLYELKRGRKATPGAVFAD